MENKMIVRLSVSYELFHFVDLKPPGFTTCVNCRKQDQVFGELEPTMLALVGVRNPSLSMRTTEISDKDEVLDVDKGGEAQKGDSFRTSRASPP